MNLIALQKLIQRWNEEAESARLARNYVAAQAFASCSLELGQVLTHIQKAQPLDTTP